MKARKLIFALMGLMVIASSCSDTELTDGNGGTGAGQQASPLVSVYASEDATEANLLAGDILVNGTRTITLSVPIHSKKVYMKYNTTSGEEKMVPVNYSVVPTSRATGDFDYSTSNVATVKLTLPEDAVQPTSETDAGYLFYHNTGVAMFEDTWPKASTGYDRDFNDVVFEYDFKVTECQDEEIMATQGSKEELLLTLDVRAVGGMYPTALGVVLEGLDSKYIDRITAGLLLKGGQGTMRDLKKVQLSTEPVVTVKVPSWKWDDDKEGTSRYAELTVDKTQPEGTIINLDGLVDMSNDAGSSEKFYFQTTWGKIRVGLPMLRAEIRLIGKEFQTAEEREAQQKAFRELINNTKRQNFFIKTHGKKEIHMKGYAPTSSYQAAYETEVQNAEEAMSDVYYCNANGAIWGMKVPVGIAHAYEQVNIALAYPDFTEWVESNGTKNPDWYMNPNKKNDDSKKETAYLVRYW